MSHNNSFNWLGAHTPSPIVVLLALIVTACQPAAQSAAVSGLQPGGSIDGMVLTTGTAEAPPLWAFCSPARESNGVTTVDCRVPPLLRLAIGYAFGLAEGRLAGSSWSALTWELDIDGQPIDLEAFGTYDFTLPASSRSPVRIREVLRQMTAWDVVITNLKPGAHTLHGLAYADAGTHKWIVNIIVEELFDSR